MKTLVVVAALFVPGTAVADPTRLWATEPNDAGNYLEVRIGPCADAADLLCGIIETARQPDGTSAPYTHLGRTIISNMAPDGANNWGDGRIWAPDDDETYRSKMELKGNVLSVAGCVVGGLICRGQDWRRIE
ncbi:MAG: DUF2147 domain-containing protein [Pseudomonadota bacterium]